MILDEIENYGEQGVSFGGQRSLGDSFRDQAVKSSIGEEVENQRSRPSLGDRLRSLGRPS